MWMTVRLPRGRSARIAVLVALALICGDCVAKAYHSAFQTAAPKTIGVAIGHDIKAVTSLSTGEEIFVALSFGMIGATLMEATAKESRLRFEDQINDMVYARVQKALAAKGYQVRRLDTVARKWGLLANIREGPGAYARVAQGYTLGREADWPDAILFLELLLEGRLEGRIFSSGKLEDLKVESMRLQYAKSKLFLYNPRTQQRLFFDMVQRSYPSFISTTVPEALDTLVALEDVPAAR